MIPLSLKLSGFLSYREPAELDFSAFDLACISGSNGAGKSSLLDAITWALFGQARRRDDALIHSACKSAEVAFDFAYEGNLYRVLRSKARDKPAALEFYVGVPGEDGRAPDWKPLTERSLRDTEAHIQQVLRMDYETFTNASFFLQGKADQFATQRPGDRKRILSSILGLDAWEEYRERAVERRRALEGEVAFLESRLGEIQAELNEEPARVEQLKQQEAELKRLSKARLIQEANLDTLRKLAASLEERRKLVESLRARSGEARQRETALQERLEQRQSERDVILAELARAEEIRARYRDWQAARAALERWEEVAARFREQEKLRNGPLTEIEAERAALQREAEGLRETARAVAALQAEAERWQAQAHQAQARLEETAAQIQRRAALQEALRGLEKQRADAQAENPRLRSEMDELKQRIEQLEAARGAACPVCGQPLGEKERETLVAELKVRGKELGERYRANRRLLQEFEERVRAMEAEIKALATIESEAQRAAQQAEQAKARLEHIRAQVEQWEASGAPRLAQIEEALRSGDFARQARARLAEVDAALRAIGYDAAAHDVVRKAEQAGRSSEAELRALEAARARLEPLEREVAELRAELAEQREEAARREAEARSAAEAYEAERASLPDLQKAERELLELQEQENALRMKVGMARQKVQVMDDLRRRQAELGAQREEKVRLVTRLKTLERAFGKDGVPALLIEQALPEIEVAANEILDRLSAGSMSVHFETQREYRDRNREDRRETLDIVVSDVSGPREYECFSGGEAFRVNFAIRLALSRVLAQRAGARLQTLVVDEGFGSQDAEGRQRLVEAINLVRPDFAKILVVTHLEELKDAFPTRIEVEKTPSGSSLRVV